MKTNLQAIFSSASWNIAVVKSWVSWAPSFFTRREKCASIRRAAFAVGKAEGA